MKNKKLSWLMIIMFVCFSGSLTPPGSALTPGSPSIVNRTPFMLPLTNMYQEMTAQSDFYTYTLDSQYGSITVDGDIAEVAGIEAFIAEYVVPASGHPAGTIYSWLMNDAQNLYITFDVTPDNTMDGNEDYVKAYIKTSDGLKVFKVSLLNTVWGVPGFRATERADYEHKVYELKIPFSEIGLADGQMSLEIAFSAYGTMAAPPPATFKAAVPYYSGGQPYGIATGRFNDDAYPDIVAVNANESTLTVLPNLGNGTFGTGVTTTGPYAPTAVIACNLNGDAYDDLVVSGSSGTCAYVSTGDNYFSSLIPIGSGYSAAVGDFDEDGYADVATTDWNQDKMFIYRNYGTGNFSMVEEIFTGDYPDAIIAADFNNDGNVDLAVVMGDRFTVSTMQIRFADGAGLFPSEPSKVISDIGEVKDGEGWYTAGGATAADFNGDGYIDIAFLYFDQYLDFSAYPEYASVLLGDGAGNFATDLNWDHYPLNMGPVDSIAGDFNDDGYLDLVAANRYSENLSVLYNAVNVLLVYKNDIALEWQPSNLTSADFNLDGMLDIALTNFDDGNVLVLLNTTGGSLFSGGTGTLEDPYIISSADDLMTMSSLAADGDDFTGEYFEQSGDISLTETFMPIKDFNGVYDGNDYTVSGLTFSSHVDYVGFFAKTGTSAELKNIVLNDVTFTNGYLYTGALVGYSDGSEISGCLAQNVYITGDSYVGGLIGCGYQTSVVNCHADGEIEGGYYTGGLIGSSQGGSITGSSASVDVIGSNDDAGGLVGYNYSCSISNCYATGTVEGTYCVGGLVGYNENAAVTNCYATGNVIGSSADTDYFGGLIGYNDDSTVTKCYSTGNVTGDDGVGGLAGYSSDASSITQCYTAGAVTGNEYAYPLVGYSGGTISGCYYLDKTYADESSSALTPDEMALQASFVDWDFVTTWQIGLDSAYDYPTLGLGGSIRSSSDDGFSISPDGLIILAAGEDQTYTIEPDSGYRIVDVTVDGETLGALSSVTFTDVQTSHKISVSVEETASADATLSALTASGLTLSPAFDSDTTSYSGSVANSVLSTTVSATPNDDKAEVAIGGTAGTSKEVSLVVGSNTIEVIVTAEDGETSKTYTITVTRAAPTGGGGGGDSSTPTGKKITVSTPDGETAVTGTLIETKSTEQVTIDKTKFETLADAHQGAVVPMPFATVTFDSKAMDAIMDASATGNAVLTVKKLDPKDLTPQQQKRVGDRPVYDFSLEKGGTKISDFDGGHAEISIPYTLKAGENPNQIVIYFLTDAGTLKPVRGHYDADSKCVVFKTTHFSAYAVGYHPVSFGDVAAGAWYKGAVDFIAAREITSGTSDGEFGPEATLTRGQFIVLLMNAYGISPDTAPDGTVNFADAGSTYYTEYLLAAKSLGIVNGVGDNMYAPMQAITRQEMFVMLYNALDVIGELPAASGNKHISQFVDAAEVAPWAKEAMTALIEGGVISGSNGMLSPAASATRSEMAQMLYNLLAK